MKSLIYSSRSLVKSVCFFILGILFLFSCSSDEEPVGKIGNEPETEIEPETLVLPVSIVNYANMDNWAFHPEQTLNTLSLYDLDIAVVNKSLELEETITITNNAQTDTGVDIFFVHPTILTGTASAAEIVAIEDQPGVRINATILAQGGLFAKYGRMFAPRYRQSTGPTYLAEDTDKEMQANIITQSYSDVKAAFMDYMDNYNNGNKIILAGHSQGSYLLAMLLADVFDKDGDMRNKLVTAVLGGMGHVYGEKGDYVGGQFENIRLCVETNECGCVHAWRSFKKGQPYTDTNNNLPFFNEELVKYGLMNRTIDLDNDWFIMDENYISTQETPFRYIALASNVNDNFGYNYVAHDNLYTAKMRRDSDTEIGLDVAFDPVTDDQRENDLASQELNPLFDFWGYHPKDYAIYGWPILQQIDAKLLNCE